MRRTRGLIGPSDTISADSVPPNVEDDLNAVVGLDPGLSGALAVISITGEPIAVYDTPTLAVTTSKGSHRRAYDEASMARLLSTIAHDCGPILVAIEQQQAMPGQGVTSMFSLGVGFGIWLGLIAALGLPHERVRPADWKRHMVAGKGKNADVLAAIRLFPSMCLYGPKGRALDGRADALLIAEFVRRRHAAFGSAR
jgi:hypothetical protein